MKQKYSKRRKKRKRKTEKKNNNNENRNTLVKFTDWGMSAKAAQPFYLQTYVEGGNLCP